MPALLNWSGALPAVHPQDQQLIQPGHIYVAPPNHHMMVEKDRIELWRGPKENLHRPAINPPFRSAAVEYGSQVAGAILTGMSDDGIAGLWWVKHYGGVTIVQDPDEAAFPELPNGALEHVDVDYIVGVAGLAPLLVALANGNAASAQLESFREPEDRGVWKRKKL